MQTYKFMAGTDGKPIAEHRFVVEQAIGRKLTSLEYVHHINGDKRDNRLENLEVVSPKEHAAAHGRWVHSKTSTCAVCGQEFTPQPTKRGRKQTCSKVCRYKLVSQLLRRPDAPNSMYRDDAYPSQKKNRK